MSELMEIVGQRMKSVRESRGMSLKDLADMSGAYISNLSCYEKGKRTPSLEMFVEIARLLGVSANYLLGGDDEEGLLLDEGLRKTILNLQSLNPRDRNIISEMIRLFSKT